MHPLSSAFGVLNWKLTNLSDNTRPSLGNSFSIRFHRAPNLVSAKHSIYVTLKGHIPRRHWFYWSQICCSFIFAKFVCCPTQIQRSPLISLELIPNLKESLLKGILSQENQRKYNPGKVCVHNSYTVVDSPKPKRVRNQGWLWYIAIMTSPPPKKSVLQTWIFAWERKTNSNTKLIIVLEWKILNALVLPTL